MAREWRDTGGRSGLPVVDLGNVLRVPAARSLARDPINPPELAAPHRIRSHHRTERRRPKPPANASTAETTNPPPTPTLQHPNPTTTTTTRNPNP